MLMVNLPRVFHIGVCGTHRSKNNCSVTKLIKRIDDILKEAWKKGKLFPRSFIFKDFNGRKQNQIAYGGWGDLRDKALCKVMDGGVDTDVLKDIREISVTSTT